MPPGNPFKCGVNGCNRSFQQHEALLQHTRAVHPTPRSTNTTSSNIFRCGVPNCGRSFPQVEHLRQHGMSHSVTAPVVNRIISRPYNCNVPGCGRRFQDPKALAQHSATHTAQGSNILPSTQGYGCLPNIPQLYPSEPTFPPSPTTSFMSHPHDGDASQGVFNNITAQYIFHGTSVEFPENLIRRPPSPPRSTTVANANVTDGRSHSPPPPYE